MDMSGPYILGNMLKLFHEIINAKKFHLKAYLNNVIKFFLLERNERETKFMKLSDDIILDIYCIDIHLAILSLTCMIIPMKYIHNKQCVGKIGRISIQAIVMKIARIIIDDNCGSTMFRIEIQCLIRYDNYIYYTFM